MIALPNVDEFRRPFIEPLGCLTLFAAQVDNLFIEIFAALNAEPETETDLDGELVSASLKLRHWDDKERETVENQIVARVSDPSLRGRLINAVELFSALRARRHRAIHDAVEVGYCEAGGAMALSVGYLKKGSKVRQLIDIVSPENIAELAREYSELRADLSSLEWQLERYLSEQN